MSRRPVIVDLRGGLSIRLDVERAKFKGQLKELHELLIEEHTKAGATEAEAKERATDTVATLLHAAFRDVSDHYLGSKSKSIDRLVELQQESLSFLDGLLRTRSTPSLQRLESLFKEMEIEFGNLRKAMKDVIPEAQPNETRAAADVAVSAPVEVTPRGKTRRIVVPTLKGVAERFNKLRAEYENTLKERRDFEEALGRIERDAASGEPKLQRKAEQELAKLEKQMRAYSAAPKWGKVEKKHMAESQAYWRGRETDTEFARHNQDFNSIAETLANKRDALLAKGQSQLLPDVDTSILDLPIDTFIVRHGSSDLITEWQNLRADPSLRAQLNKVFDLSKDPLVGGRRPDIVEFFLEHGDVVVTDITLDVESSIHQFKTKKFYRRVLQVMVGQKGPNVYGHDIDPQIRPEAPRGVIHDIPESE